MYLEDPDYRSFSVAIDSMDDMKAKDAVVKETCERMGIEFDGTGYGGGDRDYFVVCNLEKYSRLIAELEAGAGFEVQQE